MKTKKVTRYYAECGRGFWKKEPCLHHEKVCKCWTNPKHRTCKTCGHANLVNDSDGYTSWSYYECKNPNFIEEKHFTPAHEKAPDLCINCPLWNQDI